MACNFQGSHYRNKIKENLFNKLKEKWNLKVFSNLKKHKRGGKEHKTSKTNRKQIVTWYI